jgi:hypothetical protein
VTPITRAAVSVFTVPTNGPESDGTIEWTSTTIIIVEAATIEPVGGLLRPDLSRIGLGLELKRADASRYAA